MIKHRLCIFYNFPKNYCGLATETATKQCSALIDRKQRGKYLFRPIMVVTYLFTNHSEDKYIPITYFDLLKKFSYI